MSSLGTLQTALARAVELMRSDPQAAAEQAREILKVVPQEAAAVLVLGTALRASGKLDEAISVLEELVRNHAQWAGAHFELGTTYGLSGRGEDALASLRRAVALKPDHADAWGALADHLMVTGDAAAADAARARQIKAATRDPRLLQAAAALLDGEIPQAEALLREHLKKNANDVAALRMLAEVAARLGRYADAQTLLEHCLELAPGFMPARSNYAFVLNRQGKSAAALQQVDLLLVAEPRNAGHRNLKAAILVRIGELEAAIELYGEVLKQYASHPKVWMSYAHALKTAGRSDDAIAAYRRSIEIEPTLGETWWSLANLKTFHFTATETETMRRQLARTDLKAEDRYHFEFALGKALEDAQSYAQSFAHYACGNALRKRAIRYEASDTSERVARAKRLFTRQFFAERAGVGCPAADPIFIVGLPRAGSTLIEQILANHPLIEGTQELPDMVGIARQLGGRKSFADPGRYPEILATLDAQALRALGEQYLEQTRIQRKRAVPYFIDKLPNNWLHVGLIQLILPNARIIDARRHPLGCCLSAFKQHFAMGQHFSYDLTDLGLYYRDYVELMAHFDEVLPGRVHRVHYEALVHDLEGEVRALLSACGMDFHADCLHFHRSRRAVRTASSEQVRRPIFRDALQHWQHYDPWLGALRDALGGVLDAYPAVPQFQNAVRSS